ncbi:MAG: ABC transporter ATP-binding protein [Phycisphaerae bacterium]
MPATRTARQTESASTVLTEEVIRVEQLHKTYDLGPTQVHAVCGVSFTIRQGEFVSIMGASGSGKSTLLNILGCLDVASAGRFLIDGKETSQLDNEQLAALRNRDIGFVFQNFNLLSRSTALENVELPLVYLGVPAAQRVSRAEQALERVGLADRRHHLPVQLSGGQQQRVAIARALVNRPRILLADEPTGNLDTHTSADIMDITASLNRDDGIIVILVTHNPGIATFAERVIVLKDGVIAVDQPTPRRGGPPVPDVRVLSYDAGNAAD